MHSIPQGMSEDGNQEAESIKMINPHVKE